MGATLVLDERPLGELEHDVRGGKAVLVEQLFELIGELIIEEIDWGEVDGEIEHDTLRVQDLPVGECLPEDVPVDLGDQSRALRERNERIGCEDAVPWMLPADECFDPADRAGGQVGLWLVVDDELSVAERLSQFRRQLDSAPIGGVECRVEDLERNALVLRGGERDARTPQDVIAGGAMSWDQRSAGPRLDPETDAVDVQWTRQHGAELAFQGGDPDGITRGEQDPELVLAESADPTFGGVCSQPVGDLDEECVTARGAQGVVDLVEVVEVEEQQRRLT